MPIALTPTSIRSAIRNAADRGKRADLTDAGQPGLRLRVMPSGAATWCLVCRDTTGALRRFTLGAFPTLGLSAARDAARTMRHQVQRDGADPVAARRKARSMATDAKAGVGTLDAMLDAYEVQAGRWLKSWADGRKRIALVFKPLLGCPAATLTAAELQRAADAYHSAASASLAVRTLRPALKWGAQRDHLPAATANVRQTAPTVRRSRVLTAAELRRLLPVLRTSDRPQAACMRFLLLTLARRSEAVNAKWRDVDLDTGLWHLPETKNGQIHDVPLSRQASELLRSLPAGSPDDPVFASRKGAPVGNWDRETKAIQLASGTKGWTRHDLRRTGATMLGEMGELPDIIEAALNHVSIRSQLAATYNRSRYRPQVAAALQRLADALDGISGA